MSEQTNEQAVRDAYAAFTRGDVAAVLAQLTDDVEWEIPQIPNVPYTGLRRGKDAVEEFFRVLAQSEDVQAFEPYAYVSKNDMVIALGRYAARVKSNGRTAEFDWVHVFRFRGDKVSGWREYLDTLSLANVYGVPSTV
jgi:uncharacterized protein